MTVYQSQQPGWAQQQAQRLAAYTASLRAKKAAATATTPATTTTNTPLTFGQTLTKRVSTNPTSFSLTGSTPSLSFGSALSQKIATLPSNLFSLTRTGATPTTTTTNTTSAPRISTVPPQDESGTRRSWVEYQRPGYLTETMEYDPRYTPKTEEEALTIDPNNEYFTQIWLQNFYKSKGIDTGVDVKKLPKNWEEELGDLFAEQEYQKTELERQLDYQVETAAKKTKEAKSALKEELIPGREGVMSAGNVLAAENIAGVMEGELYQYARDIEVKKRTIEKLQEEQRQNYSESRAEVIRSQMTALAEAQAKLEEASNKRYDQTIEMLGLLQESGALAGLDQNTVNYLQDGLPGAPQGVVELMSRAATRQALKEDQQYKFDIQTQAIDMMKGMATEGIEMNSEFMMKMSSQTGLPFETVYSFNQRAQQILGDKELDQTQKQLEIAKLGYELDDISRGIVTEAAKNAEYINSLYASGATKDQIALAKQIMGVKDMDDLMYRLEAQALMYKNEASRISNAYLPAEKQVNLENLSIDGALKSLDAVIKEVEAQNAPERVKLELQQLKLDLQKVNTEIRETLGIQVYTSTTSKYAINTTSDGIEINAKEGASGGQCGRFVNDYFGAKLMKNSYEDKLALTDPSIKIPSPGMAFVMPLKGKYAANGHTGVVEKVFYDNNGQLMMQVVDSNWNDDEKIRRHVMPVANASGFAIPPNATTTSIKKPKTITEKIGVIEQQLPQGYEWIGTVLQTNMPDEKAAAQGELFLKRVEEGRGKEARTIAQNAIFSGASDKEKQVFKDLSVNIQRYQDILDAIEDTELAGLDLGLKTGFMNKTYKTLRKERPELLAKFDSMTTAAFVGYLKQISGTQVSEMEAQRIRELFARPDVPFAENVTLMEVLIGSTEKELDATISQATDGMFTNPIELHNALDSIERLSMKDLQPFEYDVGYQPGDPFTVYKEVPGSYSNILYSDTFTVDPYYVTRY